MNTDMFIMGERLVSRAQLEAEAQCAPKPVAVKKASFKRTQEREKACRSDGFLVVGYSPQLWSALPGLFAAAVKAHETDAKNKHPGTLNEFIASYVAKNKPKKVRSKPYELHDAAVVCADLATKAGWQRVRIDEVLKAEA